MVEKTYRVWLLKVTKYAIGVAALAWVFQQIEWKRAVTLLADVSPETIVAVLVVSAVGRIAGFSMWYLLINRIRRTKFLVAASAGLIVLFINHLLPSRLSGRAVAPFVIHSRTGMDYSDAVAVAGVHTGLFAILYGFVSFIGLALGFDQFPLALVPILLISTVLYFIAGGLVLLAGTNLKALNQIVGSVNAIGKHVPIISDRIRRLTDKIPSFMEASTITFRKLVTDPLVVFPYAVAWVIVILITRGLRVWLIFISLGVNFEPAILLPLYLLTAYSVTLLPITPGGIGVSEATATAVFVTLGVPSEVVIPAIFADRFLGTYLPALLGWYPSLKVDYSALLSNK